MKRISYLTFAAMLALCSCTDEISEEGFVDKTKTISFNAYPNKTRVYSGGDIDNATDMQNGNFGVVGYKSDNSIYLYKNPDQAVAQKWDDTKGSWEYANTGDLKFWPEGNMDFYAYFPYTDNTTFANNDDPGDVMTIRGVDCSHDVLFAYKGDQTKTDRVSLTFHHAFSKIKGLQIEMPAEGSLYQSNCQVEVKKVEFINTSTKGDVKVNNSGVASYIVNSTNDVTLNETLDPVVKINNTAGNTSKDLIDNGTNAKGYLFATNSSVTNSVTGTEKTMWDGVKSNITGENQKLSESELVCLKLTCKVWNGTDSKKYYYVGGDGENYGEVYIPLKGTDSNNNSVSTFDAGKRYTYKIVMKDNVGYKDNGDPILTPILFNASVTGWDDVTVTITL